MSDLQRGVLSADAHVADDGPDIGQISSLSFTAWRQMPGGWFLGCSPSAPHTLPSLRVGATSALPQMSESSADHQFFTDDFPIFGFTGLDLVFFLLLGKWCDIYAEDTSQAVRFYGISGTEASRSSCWQQVLKMKPV